MADHGDEEIHYTYSVNGFYQRAKHYWESDVTNFVKFMLCGFDGDGRAIVDPTRNAFRATESFFLTRDYDSLLGMHDDIMVNSYVTVQTLARKEDSLSSNVHLRYTFTSSRETFTESLHKVPNICLGTWGPHGNLLRVYLPELYDSDRPYNLLTQAQQQTFYEKGLRPAITSLIDIESLEWPATYTDEMWRARGHNGQLRLTTKTIPSHVVPDLANALRDAFRANDLPWYHGLVILHQVRGVKHATSHSAVRGDAGRKLGIFFDENDLSRDAFILGTWWIDVGLNLTSNDGRCLAWRTDAHFYLTREALGLPDHVAERITSPGSSKYTRDLTSHLTAVSGWRISPGPQAEGVYKCCYFQGYTTDKALTARSEKNHHGKFTTCQEVLNGKAVEWATSLYSLNRNACSTNLATARMEMRVPLRHALDVLIDVDEEHKELLCQSIVSVRPTAWWGVRAYRILACRCLFEWHNQGPSHLRTTHNALLLVAALVWLCNGLHAAPDKGANSKRLMDAVLPHVPRQNADPDVLAYGTPTEDDDVASDWSSDKEEAFVDRCRRVEGETLPGYPQGMVFIKRICCGPSNPVPRMWKDSSVLHPKAFKFFFKATEAAIRDDLAADDVSRPSNPDRVSNKTKHTPVYFDFSAMDVEPDAPLPLIFHLRDEGFRLLPRLVDEGADIRGDDDYADGDICKDDIDEALTEVWNQFVLDITSKAPNEGGAGNPSYLTLNAEARRQVTEDTYKDSNLAAYFRDCQWKIASKNEWNGIFTKLWPIKGFTLTANNLQNYKQARYYAYWRTMLKRADEVTAERMRTALKNRFDGFYFMPWAQSDRIWKSVYRGAYVKSSGIERTKACPLVAICPGKGAPSWVVP